jgi:hypothetical protein
LGRIIPSRQSKDQTVDTKQLRILEFALENRCFSTKFLAQKARVEESDVEDAMNNYSEFFLKIDFNNLGVMRKEPEDYCRWAVKPMALDGLKLKICELMPDAFGHDCGGAGTVLELRDTTLPSAEEHLNELRSNTCEERQREVWMIWLNLSAFHDAAERFLRSRSQGPQIPVEFLSKAREVATETGLREILVDSSRSEQASDVSGFAPVDEFYRIGTKSWESLIKKFEVLEDINERANDRRASNGFSCKPPEAEAGPLQRGV